MSEVLSKVSCDHIPEGDSCGLVVTLIEQNAKLRDENQSVGMAAYELGRKSMVDENAKLRELVRDYERCTMHADCSRCEYDGKLSTHCPLSPCFPDADELRELGVEVDA